MIFPSPGRPSGPYGNMPYIPGKISLLLLQYAYIMLATTIKVECYHRDSIYLFTVLIPKSIAFRDQSSSTYKCINLVTKVLSPAVR